MTEAAFVHKSNKEILKAILDLKDASGKYVIKPIQADILAVIGRFDRKKGNFMSAKAIRDALPGQKVQRRTVSSHLRYLADIGAVSQHFEEVAGRAQLVRRLTIPEDGPRPNLADYRTKTGMSQYRYRGTGSPDKTLSFLGGGCEIRTPHDPGEGCEFCPSGVRNSHVGGANFALPIESKDMREKKERNKHPQKPPLGQETDAPRQVTTDPPGRPSSSGQGPREEESPPSLSPQDQEQAEPLIRKKRGKGRSNKTIRERKQEARELRAKGHIANPLGTPPRKGRMLNPKRARPIAEKGNVTIPQLWAAYIQVFDDAFGLPDELPMLMPGTRENVSRFFDEMRDHFLKATGHVPDNRDLYEYLKWFHEPDRVKTLLSRRRSGDPGYVHPRQLNGLVHIKRFYDQVLSRKLRDKSPATSAATAGQRGMTDFVRDAYDKIRASESNELKLTFCVVNYGYALFAEWLRDYKGASPSTCKSRIIELFSRFIAKSQNQDSALRMLRRTEDSTKANESLFQSSVWHDWREACSDIVDLARQRAMEHAENEDDA